MRRVLKTAQRIFGIERFDPGQHKSSGLNEHKVIETLARLSSDVSWLKRGFWIMVAALVASQFVK